MERFVKINENKHAFAHLRYLRTDGMLSSYYPDFIVKCGNKIFVVETKSDTAAANDANVSKTSRRARLGGADQRSARKRQNERRMEIRFAGRNDFLRLEK